MNEPQTKVLFSFINFCLRSNRPFHRALGDVFFPALLVILPSGSLITQDKMGILHRDEDGLIVLIPQQSQDSINLAVEVIPILFDH